jgi:KaiC/GvpD/RAD55 family RecA-like ATPase
LKATKTGEFSLVPIAVYVDDTGQTKNSNSTAVRITAKLARPTFETLPNRLPTGNADLDRLLLGGIPQNYALILAATSSNERERLIKSFLEAGATAGEPTFHVTREAANAKGLAEQYPSNFYLFICNAQADALIENLANVFKLKGVENLIDIDIALTKVFRAISPETNGRKRICIEIVSDALLQHRAINTRRWLSALLPTLKSKGFTIMAIIDPQMHPPEETQSVVGLFEGEISIYEKDTPKGAKKFLKIKRMSNQKYLKDEAPLTEE